MRFYGIFQFLVITLQMAGGSTQSGLMLWWEVCLPLSLTVQSLARQAGLCILWTWVTMVACMAVKFAGPDSTLLVLSVTQENHAHE